MRYLFADSEPFPHQYDFLSAFKGFMRCASAALIGVAEARRLTAQLDAHRTQATRETAALHAFASSVHMAIEDEAAAGSQSARVQAVARQVRASLTRTIEEAKAGIDGDILRERGEIERRIGEHRAATKQQIEAFLLGHRVEENATDFRIHLVDGRYRMVAISRLPGGLVVAYLLSADRVPEWDHARRISDIAGDMQLQVGMKKKWLKRDLTREIVGIGDHFITHVALEEDRTEIRLRRKLDAAQDNLILIMQLIDGELHTEIHRAPDEENGGFPAVFDDLDKLKHLWQSIEKTARTALPHRLRVESVRLDGEDLFTSEDRIVKFIERYVDLYAPTVAEIVKRSPSHRELSLKLEHPDGRREELYLKKEELAQLMGDLDDGMLQTFATLDIFPEVQIDAE